MDEITIINEISEEIDLRKSSENSQFSSLNFKHTNTEVAQVNPNFCIKYEIGS